MSFYCQNVKFIHIYTELFFKITYNFCCHFAGCDAKTRPRLYLKSQQNDGVDASGGRRRPQAEEDDGVHGGGGAAKNLLAGKSARSSHHPLVNQKSDGLVDVEGMPVRMGAAK